MVVRGFAELSRDSSRKMPLLQRRGTGNGNMPVPVFATGQYNGDTCPTCNGLTTIRVTCPTAVRCATTITCRALQRHGQVPKLQWDRTGARMQQVRGWPRVSITGSRPSPPSCPVDESTSVVWEIFSQRGQTKVASFTSLRQMRGDAPLPHLPLYSAPSALARRGHWDLSFPKRSLDHLI